MLTLILTLAACGAEEADDTGGDTAPADTDTDTDTDTGSDTFTVVPEDPADFAGATLGLFLLDEFMNTVVRATPSHEALLDADGRFVVSFTPDTKDLDESFMASQGAAYTLLAYTGDPTDSASFVGISRHEAIFLSGTIPPDVAEIGFVAGWNALGTRGEGGPWMIPPSALPIKDNLVARESVTAGGRWAAASGARVAAVSDLDPEIALSDGDATAPWSVTTAGPPAASTLWRSGDSLIASFSPIAYDDTDGSGGYSTGDSITGRAAEPDGLSVSLLWAEPPSSVDAAHALAVLVGFRVGWDVGRWGSGAYPLEESRWGDLVMDAP